MTAYTRISTCTKNVTCLIGNVQRQMTIRVSDVLPKSCYCTLDKCARLNYSTTYAIKPNSCTPIKGFQLIQKRFGPDSAKRNNSCHSLTFKISRYQKAHLNVSTGYNTMNLRLWGPNQTQSSQIKCNIGPFSWKQSSVSDGLFFGLLVCFSTSQPSYAEENVKKEGYCDADHLHKKKVLANYSVIGIPGDGRCLFRSVAHGACIRSGKPIPNENLQRELADELRARVADEFVKRRKETEWFIEGDFDTYVSQIRKPHVWGGEPELLMASHVLEMPITVYMHDQDSGGLISIAEYGQEYGKDNPLKVLYHGYGHYDALHAPGMAGLGQDSEIFSV